MPGKDQTGPEGKGKLTGRGMGACLSDKQKKILESLGLGQKHRRLRDGEGRGMGPGLARRRGRGGRGREQ